MNYPQGPYGQGFPGQQPGQRPVPPSPPQAWPPQAPGYPQYPGYPQGSGYPPPPGYPQAPGYPPQQPGYPSGQQPQGFPPSPSSSSGVTGIIAGVLAGVVGLRDIYTGGKLGITISDLSDQIPSGYSDMVSDALTPFYAVAALYVLAGLLLAAGGVLLGLRNGIGRWVIVAGFASYVIGSLIVLVKTAGSEYASSSRYGSSPGYGFTALEVLFFLVVIAALVLAFLPTTNAWLRAQRPSAPPPSYSPYPPYRG